MWSHWDLSTVIWPQGLIRPITLPCFILYESIIQSFHEKYRAHPPAPPHHLGQCLGVSLRSSHTYLLNSFSVTGFHALTCSVKAYWTFATCMLCQALSWCQGDLYWRGIWIYDKGMMWFLLLPWRWRSGEPPTSLLCGALDTQQPWGIWATAFGLKDPKSTLHCQHDVSGRKEGARLPGKKNRIPVTLLVNCFHWRPSHVSYLWAC